ncbi:lipid asymmetry maintenance protein MlaB [Phytobacter sp. V91]|uniref:lipid asymmetry maintenance protein MlaB n=1 Tax=Phytobacter sp. V91 TaxID=3369425 RepID=UPI003F631791
MAVQLSWTRESERLALQGDLDQDVLNPLWEARVEVMDGVKCIDLQSVTRIDTAGVALLIHLIDLGKKQGHQVSLEGVSENLKTLADLYNLPVDVLPR